MATTCRLTKIETKIDDDDHHHHDYDDDYDYDYDDDDDDGNTDTFITFHLLGIYSQRLINIK